MPCQLESQIHSTNTLLDGVGLVKMEVGMDQLNSGDSDLAKELQRLKDSSWETFQTYDSTVSITCSSWHCFGPGLISNKSRWCWNISGGPAFRISKSSVPVRLPPLFAMRPCRQIPWLKLCRSLNDKHSYIPNSLNALLIFRFLQSGANCNLKGFCQDLWDGHNRLHWPHWPFACQKRSMASYFGARMIYYMRLNLFNPCPQSNIPVITIFAFYNMRGCPVPSPLLGGCSWRCPFWTKFSRCSWCFYDCWAGWVPGWCCGRRGLGWESSFWARHLIAGMIHAFLFSHSILYDICRYFILVLVYIYELVIYIHIYP